MPSLDTKLFSVQVSSQSHWSISLDYTLMVVNVKVLGKVLTLSLKPLVIGTPLWGGVEEVSLA